MPAPTTTQVRLNVTEDVYRPITVPEMYALDRNTIVHVRSDAVGTERSARYLTHIYDIDTAFAVVQMDVPAELGGGMTASRVLVHPSSLWRRFAAEEVQVTIDRPACVDCGDPAHGWDRRVIPTRATIADGSIRWLCDECAIDLNVNLAMWVEIVAAMIDTEDEAATLTPRRSRQRDQRVRDIIDGVTPAPND